jgi:cell division protein FtsQ
MWRKVLNITSWVILTAYLGVSLWFTGERMSRLTFHGATVNITDSLESHFITPAEVTGFLAKKGIRTTGSRIGELNRDQVKNTVKMLSGVKDALVYGTPDGTLHIQVWQRTPVMRFIGPNTSFYIDSDGKEMALSENYSARVLMITGSGDKRFLKDSLFSMVKLIRDQAFLDALIEEIAINPDHSLEIVPRVGDARIFFGDASNSEWKLTKLKIFYERGFPNVGWDRYSRIDLRYSNQVVARKWTAEERQIKDSVWSATDTVALKKPIKKV